MRKWNWNRRSPTAVDPDAQLVIDPDTEIILPEQDARRLRDEIDIVLVILVGGFLGTLCRYELSTHWIQSSSAFPLTIFVINVSGSLVIGFVLATIMERLRPTRYLRPLTCIGFLGGWTTMSTLALQSDHLIGANHVAIALSYVFATIFVTPVVAAVGIAIAHRLPDRSNLLDRDQST